MGRHTPIIAARWNTSSTSLTAGASVCASVISPRTTSTPCFVNLSAFSTGSTSARISSPRCCNSLIRCPPSKPVAPVISTRIYHPSVRRPDMFDSYQLVEGQKVSFTPNYATSKVGLLGSNGPEVPGWKAVIDLLNYSLNQWKNLLHPLLYVSLSKSIFNSQFLLYFKLFHGVSNCMW